MHSSIEADLDKILGALTSLFAERGATREVAILAMSKASIEQTEYDNWNGGTYGYTIYLQVPGSLYGRLADQHEEIENSLEEASKSIIRLYSNVWIQAFVLSTELVEDKQWRDKAKAWLTGQGLTNQGRARSDNLAPKMCDGLFFRSQPEIHLYRAFKALGVSFAPLPVFIRGGPTYRRIEPDFFLAKDGVFMVVEVDGDTMHRETPQEAHDRTTILLHDGVHFERVKASECETSDKASACARRMIAIMDRLKSNR